MVVIGDSDMRMNRRKVLTALGGMTIGGGALFGTGAFSTVSAERTVGVQTSGDSGAVVQFSVSGGISGSDGDTIKFNQSDVNADAITKFSGAFTITIPQGTTGTTYDVDLTDGNDNDIHYTGSAAETSSDPSFQLVGGSNDPLKFDTSAADDSKSLDVVVNTVDTTGDGTSISVDTLDISVTDTT
jgi:hypothetical protein